VPSANRVQAWSRLSWSTSAGWRGFSLARLTSASAGILTFIQFEKVLSIENGVDYWLDPLY
jgi:hypothetical protein